jgi:cytochrome c-type biogenesis protein CcmH/NrfG
MVNGSGQLFGIVHGYHRLIWMLWKVIVLLIVVFLGINHPLLVTTLYQNIAAMEFTQFSVSHQALAIQQQTTYRDSRLSLSASLLQSAVAQKLNSAPVFRLLGHVYSVRGDLERAEV